MAAALTPVELQAARAYALRVHILAALGGRTVKAVIAVRVERLSGLGVVVAEGERKQQEATAPYIPRMHARTRAHTRTRTHTTAPWPALARKRKVKPETLNPKPKP